MPLINVLFLEDEKVLQHYASVSLLQRGVNVFAAFNSLEADEILRREFIDVIVSDILLPGENGIDYIRRIRNQGIGIPVILLSALSDDDVVRVGLDAGADAYLAKPFNTAQLYEKILEVMRPFIPVPRES